MAGNQYRCSIEQGFNFQKDNQEKVGFLTALKIGDSELAKDISVTNPLDISGDKLKVVGVLSGIQWQGGYSQPVTLGCQISHDNQIKVALLVHTTLSNTAVEFQFTVYDYDPKVKKYYTCFHSGDSALTGFVHKYGDVLNIEVSDEASTMIASPKNYSFGLGVMPSETKMAIQCQVSDSDKFTKAWGVQVGA